MEGSCPHCGCDGTPPLWDRFVRFLAGEISRVTSPRVPAVGSLTFTFARYEGADMARNAIFRLGIAPTTDPNNVGYVLEYSVDTAPKDPIPVADGQEIGFPEGALVTAGLVPVGPSGPVPSKVSEIVQFTAKGPDEPPPPVELDRAPTPTFAFVRYEDAPEPPTV